MHLADDGAAGSASAAPSVSGAPSVCDSSPTQGSAAPLVSMPQLSQFLVLLQPPVFCLLPLSLNLLPLYPSPVPASTPAPASCLLPSASVSITPSPVSVPTPTPTPSFCSCLLSTVSCSFSYLCSHYCLCFGLVRTI